MPNRIAQTAEARAVNREERTIDVVASTFALDSYNTRIDPNGWDLEQFRRNPVITWAHDDRGYTASGGRPIAKGENVRVEDGKLKMRLRFPEEGKFRFADEVFNLMADGFLNAVSVGFDPIEWRDEQSEEDGHVRIFTKQRLMELAVVTIPSNSEALAERAKRMNADPDEVRVRVQRVEELAEQMRFDLAQVEIWRNYFETKKPVNRAAGQAMKRFFEVRGEKQPENELDAFTRMSEIIEEEAERENEEPESPPTGKPEQTTEKNEEEPITPQTAEDPQTERKASVRIPLSVLKALPGAFMDSALEAAEKASQRGIPASQWGGVVEKLGEPLHTSISNS